MPDSRLEVSGVKHGRIPAQFITSYLKMDWTATIVLQSDSVSSSPAFELSLLTMTILSARLTPASSKSSRLQHHMTASLSRYYGSVDNTHILSTTLVVRVEQSVRCVCLDNNF